MKRIIRERFLTADEAAADQAIRDQVAVEFNPQSDAELVEALAQRGLEIVEKAGGFWLQNKRNLARSERLKADDRSAALKEGWERS